MDTLTKTVAETIAEQEELIENLEATLHDLRRGRVAHVAIDKLSLRSDDAFQSIRGRGNVNLPLYCVN